MIKSIIIAGFGGQGVMLMGKIIAESAMLDGLNVTWLPSYGPEMRGGTANCTVIVGDEPIGSPVVDVPDVVIAMNIPSMIKFEEMLKKDGIMILNSSVIDREPSRKDIKVYKIDANKIADAIGNSKVLNMVTLGAFARVTGLVKLEMIGKALEETFAGKNKKLIDLNLEAVRQGMNSVS
ncbi:2-oxoacid:acceptor oxidoreductase family protein [Athalassotoga saccharophila]|uniref:2-oxoacid:acceptor oxidoreductase family protein n=1 Tax=Athalassotoga saccharophila TaxID=1441386 RepID=UPI00137AB142|nr:2-oxoacid:acceptor oxidoreductase family protein [Athalassotoga saccharophila]BBJ28730.1 2-oxoglutarate/2-oxoacid ferredoxin oxidoreductase, gamma subunit [Athalassotoga saccharophila]